MKRVFGIDIETCPACGGAVRIIARIEDAEVIEKILTHLDGNVTEPEATRRPPCRALPQRGLFGESASAGKPPSLEASLSGRTHQYAAAQAASRLTLRW